MGDRRTSVGTWLRERFPILGNHPGETEAFRRRFHNAVALVLAYRALGMVPATMTFIAAGDRVAVSQTPGLVLATLYVVTTLVAFAYTADFPLHIDHPMFQRRSFRFGFNRAGWIDHRRLLELDLAVAIAFNLLVAAIVNEGAAYDEAAGVMAVANITTVVLWTGRRGGWIGLRVVGIIAIAEFLKGPLNGAGLAGIDITEIMIRLLWVLCGWLVALGVVRILLDYAERAERRRIEDEELWAIWRSHDVYRNALTLVADLLDGIDGDNAARARLLAVEASDGRKKVDPNEKTIGAIAEYAAARGRAANPAMNFIVVDATYGGVAITEPMYLSVALSNLCINAARHSKGTRTTVKCSLHPAGGAEVSVRDNGVGMSVQVPTGGGIGIVRKAAEALGGDVHRDPVPKGSMWVFQIPANILYGVEAQ